MRETKQARAALDARLSDLGSPDRFAVPRSGWVRAIRDALGMPAAELARRLGVTHGAVLALERSEVEGVARLDSLRKASKALDCTLVYAFIPKHGLEATVRERAEDIVDENLSHVLQSMALEDQAAPVTPESREELVREVLNTRGLWNRRS
jgi:predicted DNA-binding mobile mystery protein A